LGIRPEVNGGLYRIVRGFQRRAAGPGVKPRPVHRRRSERRSRRRRMPGTARRSVRRSGPM